METKKILRIILLVTISLSYAISADADTCPILKIETPTNPQNCAEQVDGTAATFKIQKCSNQQVCPFNFEQNPQNAQCKAAVNKAKGYPSGSCNLQNPCILAKIDKDTYGCSDNTDKGGICKGAKHLNEACDTQNNACDFGLVCKRDAADKTTGVCSFPKTLGEDCFDSSECERNAGCNKVCTEYFTLDAGTKLAGDDALNALGLSFCKSGLSDSENTCKDYAPLKTDCVTDADCTADTKITEVCSCGFTDGKKKCRVGTDSAQQKDLIASVKSSLSVLDKCNADEDFVLCNQYKVQPSPGEFKKIEDYRLKLWLRDNFNKLPAAADTETAKTYRDVVETNNYSQIVVTPLADGTPTKAEVVTDKKCSPFVCPSTNPANDKTLCADHTLNDDSKTYEVRLYNQCTGDTVCGDDSKYYKLPLVPGTKLTCAVETTGNYARYPEEACTTDSQCSSGKCDNNKCTFPAGIDGNKCVDSTECGIGKFCDKNNQGGTCTYLLSSGSNCDNTYQCAMNLVCYKGKCAAPYTSSNWGDKVDIPDTEAVDKALFCSTGRVNADGVCVSLIAADKVEDYGLTPCSVGHDCNYYEAKKDGDQSVPIKKTCECGFNAKGQAYCPLADNQRTSDWTTRRTNYVNTLSNSNCHTLNRYSCYPDSSYSSAYWGSLSNTDNYHQFYGAVDCAKTVLSSSFLKISGVFLLVLAALLL